MTKFAAFENWGTWTVQKFVDGKGGEIVATFKGEGWQENERKARALVAELQAA